MYKASSSESVTKIMSITDGMCLPGYRGGPLEPRSMGFLQTLNPSSSADPSTQMLLQRAPGYFSSVLPALLGNRHQWLDSFKATAEEFFPSHLPASGPMQSARP